MKKKIWIYKLFIIWSLFFLTYSCEKDESKPNPEYIIEYGSVLDIDGNSYKTVKIGNQWWMAENLKVTKYRNGDPIPNISINSEWKNTSEGAFCNYDNNSSNGEKFGKLYNWEAVRNERTLAPLGWHVPSDDEWTTLTDYLSHNTEFVNYGCVAELLGWKSNVGESSSNENNTAYNRTGFNAIQCGSRQGNGLFINHNSYSNWWSSTYFGNGLVWCRHIYSDDGCSVFYIMQGAKNGFSVRCVKDEFLQVALPKVNTNAPTNITHNSATLGGKIINENGAKVSARGVVLDTIENPTLENNKITTFDSSNISTFSSTVTDLDANTLYYVRAYATNSKGTAYGSQVNFTTAVVTQNLMGTFTDTRDNRTYKWVKIGNQTWMAENMAYLPSVNLASDMTGHYFVNGYDGTDVNAAKSTANYATYGVLYTWSAAMDRNSSSYANPSGVQGISPLGWHIPSEAEWVELENYLIVNGYNYDSTFSGNKIAKSMASQTNWGYSLNTGAIGNKKSTNNISGFSALPGGARIEGSIGYPGHFNNVGNSGIWWSCSDIGSNAMCRYLFVSNAYLKHKTYPKVRGFSVRCIRDD